MASSRPLYGTRRNDYQPEQNNSQLFQKRSAASDNRSEYLDSRGDHYSEGYSNHFMEIHSDRYLDSRQGRQSSNVRDGRNNRLLNSQSDLLELSVNSNERQHLENEYDQYISELDHKRRYSDKALNSTNSDLGRNSNLMDRNTVSNLGINDRFGNLNRNSLYSNLNRNNVDLEMKQNNTLSSLVQNNHLSKLDRDNFRGNIGTNSITPWQVGAGPAITSNLHPIGAVPNKMVSTIELANNLLSLFQQQPQQNPPSLLDVRVPQRSFNIGAGRASMGNQQRSATDSRLGAGNRKSYRGPAGQTQPNKNLPRKDNKISSKPKVRTSNPSNAGIGKKTQNTEVDADYNDILTNLFNCHICKKSVPTPKAFVLHLKGKAHAALIKKTAEEYELAANQMRAEIRDIESNKPYNQGSLNFHCSMCNFDAGDSRQHRSSPGHRKLRKYLHPWCHTCNLNFANRILYDEHLLSAAHLKKVQAKANQAPIKKTEGGQSVKPKKELQIFTMDMEKSYVRERFERKKAGKNKDQLKEKPKEENSKEHNEAAVDPDNLVLDYMEGDDLTGVTPNMLPAYNTEQGVGDSFISEFRCFQCKLCNKLLENEETAKIHLKTWGHHRQFTKMILNKIKGTKDGDDQQNKDSEVANAEKQQTNKDSGNWKRRKTSEKSFVEVHEEQEDEEIPENDENGVDSQLPPNDELEDWDYDDDKGDIKNENDDDVILVE